MINAPQMIKGDENFWELNPEFKIIFDIFYSSDKSKGKEESSKIMWAMYFKLHPDSNFYNLPDKDDIIKNKFLKRPDFKWETYEDVELMFINAVLTQAERSLYEWNEFMKKRDKYLKNTEYYFDTYMTDNNGDNVLSKTGKFITLKGTAQQLDLALSVTPKLFLDYGKIMKELKEERIKKGKGNKPLSASDSDRI